MGFQSDLGKKGFRLKIKIREMVIQPKSLIFIVILTEF